MTKQIKLAFCLVVGALAAALWYHAALPSFAAAQNQHWAFVAPVRPAVPAGAGAVDFFVEKTLTANALKFSPPAEAGALLRRVTLDLTGLPPTLAELDAFEHGTRSSNTPPPTYEQVVDRLLASPRYGERMAMDWLDAARYAEIGRAHV